MNVTHHGENYGATQYRWALDYELAGRSFTVRTDMGSHVLAFQDRSFIDCDGVLSQYEALKLQSDLHVVFFGETVTVAVLDLANGTAVLSTGEKGCYEFGRIEGLDKGAALPGYTDEMTGTHVRWVIGCDRYLEHAYLEDGKCRTIWSPRTDLPRTLPASFVKIGEGLYLTEVNGTSPFHTDLPQGYSKVVMVQDYEHMLMVGCIYSPRLNDFRLISGYGLEPEKERG